MKAARLRDYGGPDNIVYEDAPEPQLQPGQVLVRVAAAAVNPMDVKLRSGAFKDFMPLPLPFTFGADIAGTVAAVGGAIENFKVGDRVMALTMSQGGYAELAACDASVLAKVPDGLALEAAASLPMVGLTAAAALDVVQPKPGQRVLVSGALGSIGRLLVQMLKRESSVTVIAGVRGSRTAGAASLGADEVIALDHAGSLQAGGPFDVVYDVTGGTSAQELVSQVRKGGAFVAINPPPPQAPADGSVEVKLVQVTPDPARLAKLAAEIARGDLQLPINKTLPLSQAAEAHRIAEAEGSSGKVLLVP